MKYREELSGRGALAAAGEQLSAAEAAARRRADREAASAKLREQVQTPPVSHAQRLQELSAIRNAASSALGLTVSMTFVTHHGYICVTQSRC